MPKWKDVLHFAVSEIRKLETQVHTKERSCLIGIVYSQ